MHFATLYALSPVHILFGCESQEAVQLCMKFDMELCRSFAPQLISLKQNKNVMRGQLAVLKVCLRNRFSHGSSMARRVWCNKKNSSRYSSNFTKANKNEITNLRRRKTKNNARQLTVFQYDTQRRKNQNKEKRFRLQHDVFESILINWAYYCLRQMSVGVFDFSSSS